MNRPVAGKLSVIVPVYNEGDAVWTAYRRIEETLNAKMPQWDFEIIFVDDGSRDDSFAQLRELCSQHSHAVALRFAANCGSHMAIRAGFEHATGDAACFLACDLQDPPEVIPAMIARLIDPVQIVWAVRNTRQDPWSARFFSAIYHRLARLLVSKNIPPAGSSMVLIGSGPLKMMSRYKERNVALEGLFANMGFPHAYVPCERQPRLVGQSKWTLGKKIKLFIDSILSFSYVPIRVMSLLGLLLAVSGFAYALVVVIGRLTGWVAAGAGFAALMTVLLVGQGCILLMLGVLGEYLWRTFDEVRGRPRYIIEEIRTSTKDLALSQLKEDLP